MIMSKIELLRNIQVSGKARLVLTPTISELPFVGGIQFFFLTKPEIDFDFDGVAKLASKLPAIKRPGRSSWHS